MARRSHSKPRSNDTGRFRIIGGRHRGRRLEFEALPGLRPTPDRVRETLFNWLSERVPGARCLDLYAGSGALGLEAMSRGAAKVDFVDISSRACARIVAHVETLGATGASTVVAAAEDYVRRAQVGSETTYDVVFLDPPFADHALPQLCTLLASSGLLAPGAAVYLEHAVEDASPDRWAEWPSGWELHRSRRAGEVAYHLALTAAD